LASEIDHLVRGRFLLPHLHVTLLSEYTKKRCQKFVHQY
jgi:hypothetical protein